MTPNMVAFYIAAQLGVDYDDVFWNFQPDADTYPSNCVTVYVETGSQLNIRSDVRIIAYQTIVRHTDDETCETWARTILDAVRENNSLKNYAGAYLTASMNNTSNPVTFDPDNGSGTSKATAFATNDYVLIDDEILRVTNVTGDTVTASRAALGTTIAAHSDNDEVHNISQNPVPGKTCDSTWADEDIISMGVDENDRMEYAVNWFVRLKA